MTVGAGINSRLKSVVDDLAPWGGWYRFKRMYNMLAMLGWLFTISVNSESCSQVNVGKTLSLWAWSHELHDNQKGFYPHRKMDYNIQHSHIHYVQLVPDHIAGGHEILCVSPLDALVNSPARCSCQVCYKSCRLQLKDRWLWISIKNPLTIPVDWLIGPNYTIQRTLQINPATNTKMHKKNYINSNLKCQIRHKKLSGDKVIKNMSNVTCSKVFPLLQCHLVREPWKWRSTWLRTKNERLMIWRK